MLATFGFAIFTPSTPQLLPYVNCERDLKAAKEGLAEVNDQSREEINKRGTTILDANSDFVLRSGPSQVIDETVDRYGSDAKVLYIAKSTAMMQSHQEFAEVLSPERTVYEGNTQVLETVKKLGQWLNTKMQKQQWQIVQYCVPDGARPIKCSSDF